MNLRNTLAMMLLSVGLCACGRNPVAEQAPLLCYVGGTMRPAVEELARRYEAATQQKVLLDFGDSGQLMIKIEQTRRGDIYVCHDPFLAGAIRKGLAVEGRTVSALNPVIVATRGNPKGITRFADLAQPGIRLVLTDAQYSTMGHIVDRMAEKVGIQGPLNSNVVSRTRGGGEAANAVVMQTADASVVWNAVAWLRKDKLDAIPIEPAIHLQQGVDAVTSATYGRINMDYVQVTAAVLKSSSAPDKARKFIEFMASEEGQKVWAQHGFSPMIPGREYRSAEGVRVNEAGRKTLLVHCGAGLRKVMDPLARQFEAAHGAQVDLSYDGSNRLLGQIKLTRRGDVFIPGDAEYVDMAIQEGLARTGTTICCFVPVILVQNGNPRNIQSPADLLKEGVRLGLGDEKAAAVGKQTVKVFALNGLERGAWEKNVVLSTPTVNELGAAIKLKTIDAAVVWSSTAADYADVSTVVPFEAARNIVSDVKGSVLSFAQEPEVAQAFLDFLSSTNVAPVFVKYGYVLRGPEKAVQ